MAARNLLGREHVRRLARLGLKFCAMLATVGLSVLSIGAAKEAILNAHPTPTAALQADTVTKPSDKSTPTAQRQREIWRRSMARSRRPKKGCFKATYPETTWREIQCTTPPNRPYPPRKGPRPQTVGNGLDFAGQVTTNTTQAEGSFDSVTGVTSESSGGTANAYSLQLNTNFFTTSACSGAQTPASCLGWEQFVFSSSASGAFIQYWMINYANPCPATWIPYGSHCYRNAVNSAPVPAQTIASLGQILLDGAVAGVNGNANDQVSLTIGTTIYSAPGDNPFPDLTNGWRISEFNVFGDCCGYDAAFNIGSTIVVRTAVNSGTPATEPVCSQQGFTGETNNLTLVSTPAVVADVQWPSVVFTQSNAGAPTTASCATADSFGDTHLKTFNGLMYDFQASGDFVLAQAGADFAVQARQASGAPTWPNMSVNKAVVTQMGNTNVAIYIEPTRLMVDGQSNNLADGGTIFLPSGVQVTRQGNTYAITSETGNSVRAVLNSSWMNVTVGLGQAPQPSARGLLGNPSGSPQELVTSKGDVLRMPVSFTDLYHPYADSWRVQPNESLFTGATRTASGIPDKLFYASQLDRQEYTRARRICTAAGVKSQALLDACTLDNAVLKDKAATRVFLRMPRPRAVLIPRADARQK